VKFQFAKMMTDRARNVFIGLASSAVLSAITGGIIAMIGLAV